VADQLEADDGNEESVLKKDEGGPSEEVELDGIDGRRERREAKSILSRGAVGGHAWRSTRANVETIRFPSPPPTHVRVTVKRTSS
jgi:hypothetical protein